MRDRPKLVGEDAVVVGALKCAAAAGIGCLLMAAMVGGGIVYLLIGYWV